MLVVGVGDSRRTAYVLRKAAATFDLGPAARRKRRVEDEKRKEVQVRGRKRERRKAVEGV